MVCSITDWLDNIGVANFGERKWRDELDALNTQTSVVLRVNRLKTNLKSFKRINAGGVQARFSHPYPDALILEERANVFDTDSFQKGFFEVQDASSQQVDISQSWPRYAGNRCMRWCW